MRKLSVVFASLLLVFILAACGETTTEDKEINSVESSSNNDKAENNVNNGNEEAESETEEVGEVIADDDYVKATLVNVEYVNDEMFDEQKYVINIDLENKTSDKIVVQARDVSIDGTMVDDMVFFSEEIAGDKNANGKMEIQNYEGDLPTMDDNIEFILLIVDEETFEDKAEHDVKVDF